MSLHQAWFYWCVASGGVLGLTLGLSGVKLGRSILLVVTLALFNSLVGLAIP